MKNPQKLSFLAAFGTILRISGGFRNNFKDIRQLSEQFFRVKGGYQNA
jgi:hypothetical protein